ncbi:hypothetical protein B0T19DRAFT_419645 [Cercophora scortea]|uniref:Uncharacterized protein n=1 Tax=Cercophora scortea TaxID=314031 RepID=A0AAE0IZ31_9PEZI|nr:hypothetical protein B0T19DRAFT_419645 [Cercophora scortea]
MLRERNIYRVSDPVYLERQQALRVIEHKIEGRPFRPALRAGEMDNKDWKRLWSRLSKVLPRAQPPTPASSVADDDGDGDTDLSGFSTYEPTPEPPSPVPVFADPWERMEYERKRSCWSEEEYQFRRIFLKEGLIDRIRAEREDEKGDRQREKELEEIEKVRYIPNTGMISEEYERRMKHFNHRAEGWTQEQVDAEDRAIAAKRAAFAEERLLKILRTNKPMTERLAYSFECAGLSRERQAELAQKAGYTLELESETEEIEAEERKFMESIRLRREQGLPRTGDFNPFYIALGVSQERQAELAQMFDRGLELARPGAQTSKRLPQQRASPRQQLKDTSRKTRGGRVSKDTVQTRGGRSRKSAPTPAKVSGADIVQAQDGPRKSRRLAGLEPEVVPSPPHETTSPRLPSNTRKTNSSRPRSGKLPKTRAADKGVKPQGISKSSQAGRSRGKRGSRG